MLNWFARRMQELQKAKRDEQGFTLIELLVVVIIIGILAAIAIPTFLSQREGAWEKAAQSDARNASTSATACATDANGSYAACNTAALLKPYGYNKSADVTVNGINADADEWAISTQNTKGGKAYILATFGANAGQVQEVARGTAAPAVTP